MNALRQKFKTRFFFNILSLKATFYFVIVYLITQNCNSYNVYINTTTKKYKTKNN